MSAFATVREYQSGYNWGHVVVSTYWYADEPVMHGVAHSGDGGFIQFCKRSARHDWRKLFPTRHAVKFARPCRRCFPGERP